MDTRKIGITILTVVLALMSKPALSEGIPEGGPCGGPVCPSGLGSDIARLQGAWSSSATTADQRDKMKEIIASNTADGATDWKAAADEYAKWRATTFGYEYKPYEDKPRAQGPEEDWYGMRVLAEKSIRSMLIDPESARFEWPRGFMRSSWKPSIFGKRVKGYVSCGLVNSRNRMGGYAGTAPFVVVIDNGRVLHASIGTEQDFDITSIGCREAMKQLPPPQEAMLKTQPTSPPAASIADEIAKLASLRDRGILTQAEFDEQKALLLRH